MSDEVMVSNKERCETAAVLAMKPFRMLRQLDGFADAVGDSVIDPDGDGYGVMGGLVVEPFNATWSVRLYLREDVTREDALALLDEMRDWIEKSGEWPLFQDMATPGAAQPADDPDMPF